MDGPSVIVASNPTDQLMSAMQFAAARLSGSTPVILPVGEIEEILKMEEIRSSMMNMRFKIPAVAPMPTPQEFIEGQVKRYFSKREIVVKINPKPIGNRNQKCPGCGHKNKKCTCAKGGE